MSVVYPDPTIANLVKLYYYDRFGSFALVDKILEDYRFTGKYPLNLEPTIILTLEKIIQLSPTGQYTTPEDRESAYRRCLGWSLYRKPKYPADMHINHEFSNFHKFIKLAIQYFKQKQIAVAIKGSQKTDAPPSLATEASIKNTCILLKNSFDTATYGRNLQNTVLGIEGLAESLNIVNSVKTIIGVPDSITDPAKIMDGAYSILIKKTSNTSASANRYKVHDELANTSFKIILEIYGFDFNAPEPSPLPPTGTLLTEWLTNLEKHIESYRTHYSMITKVDLGEMDIKTDPNQMITIPA